MKSKTPYRSQKKSYYLVSLPLAHLTHLLVMVLEHALVILTVEGLFPLQDKGRRVVLAIPIHLRHAFLKQVGSSSL